MTRNYSPRSSLRRWRGPREATADGIKAAGVFYQSSFSRLVTPSERDATVGYKPCVPEKSTGSYRNNACTIKGNKIMEMGDGEVRKRFEEEGNPKMCEYSGWDFNTSGLTISIARELGSFRKRQLSLGS